MRLYVNAISLDRREEERQDSLTVMIGGPRGGRGSFNALSIDDARKLANNILCQIAYVQSDMPTIKAWADYGVRIEPDASGAWHWAETEDMTREVNGPFSPYFRNFEACVADLVNCFGPLT